MILFSFLGIDADGVGISIAAPPVDGEANSELIKFVSKELKVRKSDVSLEKVSPWASELNESSDYLYLDVIPLKVSRWFIYSPAVFIKLLELFSLFHMIFTQASRGSNSRCKRCLLSTA